MSHRQRPDHALKECARRGHVPFVVSGHPVADVMNAKDDSGVALCRCLRCGVFVAAAGAPSGHPDAAPVVAGALHAKRERFVRVFAIERLVRGVLLLAASLGIFELALHKSALLTYLRDLTRLAEPVLDRLGIKAAPGEVPFVEHYLKFSPTQYTVAATLVGLYGILQLVEFYGLWRSRRWAEYVAVSATSLFLPLEIIELSHGVNIYKTLAFLLNVLFVAYMVRKGRLFSVRGGLKAHLAEIREESVLGQALARLESTTG